ncbi:MAG: penicillin-insensitive murein endopeptidase [Sandaracinus sp.]
MPRLLVSFAALALAGCWALGPLPAEPTSLGTTSCGIVCTGAELPDRGEAFLRGRPGEETRVGVPRLVEALGRAASAVRSAHPGTQDLRIGDVGAPHGGHHPRHASHRAGRDVDILFYVEDAAGRPVPSAGFVAFSRFGHAFSPEGDLYFFDDARNWELVRTLLTDETIEVQWIFCSRGVEARLLAYALEHEPDPDVLFRAPYVLQQPENARPHDDHFHVRVYCSAEERAEGCRDIGPRWPWLRPDVEALEGETPSLDDAALLELLRSD